MGRDIDQVLMALTPRRLNGFAFRASHGLEKKSDFDG